MGEKIKDHMMLSKEMYKRQKVWEQIMNILDRC